ncbi:uncharacterized protein FIBRA_09329 [Fibroporia radiculosa]|uniref:Alpha/beta hydrolase fold-3 domain-containing protein n=1 Tax=Fibroporia radiculosa TaxID=599839 RepID=J7RVS2_9APHY|nr:uncharacterized protein FIBRA_09329 [Fibroporia radiculosa]CCM07010.1 predicted protein [Fibroporia radiculosa]
MATFNYFAYRHQPLKTLFLLYTGVSLFVRIPFWITTNLLPSWRPRRSWTLSRTLIVNLLRVVSDTIFKTSVSIFSIDPKLLEQPLAAEAGLVWVDPTPDLILGEIKDAADLNGVTSTKVAGFWYGERGLDGVVGQKADPDEKVIYELHGGGFVTGNASPKGNSAYFCNQMLQFCDGYHRIFQVEYRLSQGLPLPPKNPFPAALIDAIAGYNYLVNVVGYKPCNILVMGESSGGNLALALVRYLVNYAIPSLPPPHAQFLLSPTLDWGCTHVGPGSAMERNCNSDLIYAFVGSYTTRALLGSLPETDAYANVWISPGSGRLPSAKGRFAGLPQTLIIAGDAEMTLDGMRMLRDRMIADNGNDIVTYIELPDATHCSLSSQWHMPESIEGYSLVANWLQGTNSVM